MKKMLFALPAFALLSACSSSQNRDWSNDCEKNYTLNSREKSECLQKVEKHAAMDLVPGTVSIDSANTDRQSFDNIGKNRNSRDDN